MLSNNTFIEQFILFLHNPIFLSCLFSWFGAQFLKTAIKLIYGRIHSIKELFEVMVWRTGGMPSSHSALVTSLCTTIGFRHGIHSDIFVFAFCFFLVVVRDAFGVRRSSGLQAKKINEIGNSLSEKGIVENYKPMKEVDGHTPMEVLCGCIFGFLVGLSFSLLK
ncbi:MAG: divergent PAP2 family protein [Treponema sp.]|nr:divergent PAP2 family protein [Treponema sp.]